MSTSESGQAASKNATKFSDPKHGKTQPKVTAPKAVSQPIQPSKAVSSKEIKASGSGPKGTAMIDPIAVTPSAPTPEEPVRRSIFKSTFNTHDIMHAPAEKTIQMLDKILAGERLFTM